ncbi:hypothetical protein PPACK8108_LOCUS21812 [Phakopsora pachyrhizi]|uniref:Uncharacterized protein n=1 Tax=Phakopsora pachyrhizi TaxID=170000 RepID=A0AAV0BJF8_PHAPC|nr:hypothetical protein PPACK8108_LOCUS21812 [Phakopsora pachyrhizi]
MPSNSPEMTNLKVTETSNFNQASSTTLEEDPYIKRGNKSIHTETGKHLNNALQSPTQSPRMTRLQGCVLPKLSTPFILTGPSESSASKPYHSVHQQNSGCWKLEQPGWLWENHLSTLCSVSSSSAWLGHIHQPADLRLRLESTLATLREIYQVRGLGDGQGLGLTDQVSGDPQSVLVSLPSGMVFQGQGPMEGLICVVILRRRGEKRKLTRLVGGTETLSPVVASELRFSVSPNLICSYRSLSQPSNSTPGDGEDLLPAVAGFGDLFAPGADNDAL